jgi:hypothetical protein
MHRHNEARGVATPRRSAPREGFRSWSSKALLTDELSGVVQKGVFGMMGLKSVESEFYG